VKTTTIVDVNIELSYVFATTEVCVNLYHHMWAISNH